MPHEVRRLAQIERYQISRSPLAQKPTQRDIAALLKETRDDLRRLVNYKESFIVRREIVTGKNGKVRALAYPDTRLRAVHERLKYHLNKVKQPNYLFSPRKGKRTRDNALVHIDQFQYLTLDLKQFYPSTSDSMVRKWFREQLSMYPDVAGLLTHLCTVDGIVSLGSSLTPVLCSLIHRGMFDRIAAICDCKGLQYSVWVDDLTISGCFVPRDVLHQIRSVVRESGLKSHKIEYRSGSRPVFITGIGIVGRRLIAPNSINLKLKDAWTEYYAASTDWEKDSTRQRLLSYLGTVRHISGPGSLAGQKAANQMAALRQQKCKRASIESPKAVGVDADQLPISIAI